MDIEIYTRAHPLPANLLKPAGPCRVFTKWTTPVEDLWAQNFIRSHARLVHIPKGLTGRIHRVFQTSEFRKWLTKN